jgi:hypothetical protein
MITISNDGQAVVATNYWSTPPAVRGLLYLTINAGALRLLVPDATVLREVPPPGTPCIYEQGSTTCRLLWLDDPARPYAILISVHQVDRRLPPEDRGRHVPLIWYAPADGEAVQVLREEQVQIA